MDEPFFDPRVLPPPHRSVLVRSGDAIWRFLTGRWLRYWPYWLVLLAVISYKVKKDAADAGILWHWLF